MKGFDPGGSGVDRGVSTAGDSGVAGVAAGAGLDTTGTGSETTGAATGGVGDADDSTSGVTVAAGSAMTAAGVSTVDEDTTIAAGAARGASTGVSDIE